MPKNIDIGILKGKTLVEIKKTNKEITLKTDDNRSFKLYHDQDCCEHVYIEDVNGDINDLLNTPITLSEEAVSREARPNQNVHKYEDSFTWTFYRLATVKGYVNIRWLGQSNGYYSERVSFIEII